MADPTDSTLKQIKRLCILNFLELQDLKRRLNITETTQDVYDYANEVEKWMEKLEGKQRNLIKDYPALLDKE